MVEFANLKIINWIVNFALNLKMTLSHCKFKTKIANKFIAHKL